MALKLTTPFPLFSPFLPPSHRPAMELRFSRWNNANAEPFNRRRREQQEIEADIRLHRRHHSAAIIASSPDDPDPAAAPSPEFHSRGTPSAPSSPSIRGKASKYSKPLQNPRNRSSHPAFRRISRARIPPEPDEQAGIVIGERGIAYRVKNAPFEFQYSYTETPKMKPLALREAPFLPFGPSTMPRPWTGRAPLPASNKKLPEFDSFRPPPPGKKGVKPVQSPGPFLAGSGPKYKAMSREEILGEPLTEEEVKDLIKSTLKTSRQLNMGRDGLTHNMLDNIHSHWKRTRVCKIKCKGVCTVDMDNVRQQLEEKTGGKIIYNRGGVIYLFRGRNYNYKIRPRYPLMLWKPVTPVYPRLIPHVPEGLTLEEATEMRKRGRKLPPICRLGKNGVYSNLVKIVKEAFEECELVRINCTGLNKSDCRKIGAKLKNLVPCVLISFEYEHILMWRGKDWKSSLPPPEDGTNMTAMEPVANALATMSVSTTVSSMDLQGNLEFSAEKGSDQKNSVEAPSESVIPVEDNHVQHDIPSYLESSNEWQTSAFSDSAKSSLNAANSLVVIGQKKLGSRIERSSIEDPNLDTPCQDISHIQGLGFEEINSSSVTESASGEKTSAEDSGLEEKNLLVKEEELQLLATSGTSSSLNVSNSVIVIQQETLDSGTNKSIIEDSNPSGPYQDIPKIHNLNFEENTSSTVLERDGVEKSSVEDSSLQIEYQDLVQYPALEESNSSYVEEEEPQLVADSDTSCTLNAINEGVNGADAVSRPHEIGSMTESPQPDKATRPAGKYLDRVMFLFRQAITNGSAIVLDDDSLDANIILEKSVALAKSAPPGPSFQQRIRKAVATKSERKDTKEHEEEYSEPVDASVAQQKNSQKKSSRTRNKDDFGEVFSDVVPQGSLRIDELARLLA